MGKKPIVLTVLAVVLLVWGGAKLFDKNGSQGLSAEVVARQDAQIAASTKARMEREARALEIENSLSENDRKFVCRSAIAALMGRDVSTISASVRADGFIGTSYVRPSDGARWNNVCKLKGDRVIWASVQDGGLLGRWRTDPADEKVLYVTTSDEVTISQKFTDGTSLSNTFERVN